jgi:hypothetical protein
MRVPVHEKEATTIAVGQTAGSQVLASQSLLLGVCYRNGGLINGAVKLYSGTGIATNQVVIALAAGAGKTVESKCPGGVHCPGGLYGVVSPAGANVVVYYHSPVSE